METRIVNELETITQKIETNTANLADYKRYEVLLTNGGLTHDYIYSYLYKAGIKHGKNLLLQDSKNKET